MTKVKIIGILIILMGIIILSLVLVPLQQDFINYIKYQKGYVEYDQNIEIENIFGVLEIDKINLRSIIYNREDDENDVNKNIYLANATLNEIVLAAHSGNSLISYFKNLDELKNDDEIIFIKGNLKWTYEIFNSELVNKTGVLNLVKYNYPILSLVTCSKQEKDKQIVYYARLIKSENYG